MVVYYERASEERDALLAQELHRYREGANLGPLAARTTTLKCEVRSSGHPR